MWDVADRRWGSIGHPDPPSHLSKPPMAGGITLMTQRAIDNERRLAGVWRDKIAVLCVALEAVRMRESSRTCPTGSCKASRTVPVLETKCKLPHVRCRDMSDERMPSRVRCLNPARANAGTFGKLTSCAQVDQPDQNTPSANVRTPAW